MIVNSMENMALARPITVREPDNIAEAIKLYEERIRLLNIVKNKGFDTLAEHQKVKEAEDLVAKHKKKMDENAAAAAVTTEDTEDGSYCIQCGDHSHNEACFACREHQRAMLKTGQVAGVTQRTASPKPTLMELLDEKITTRVDYNEDS